MVCFCFSRFWDCSDWYIFVFLDFEIVLTVWYIFVFLDFIPLSEQFQNLEKQKYTTVRTIPKSRKTKTYHTVRTIPKSRKTKDTIVFLDFGIVLTGIFLFF
jgi:hypothetical protein